MSPTSHSFHGSVIRKSELVGPENPKYQAIAKMRGKSVEDLIAEFTPSSGKDKANEQDCASCRDVGCGHGEFGGHKALVRSCWATIRQT